MLNLNTEILALPKFLDIEASSLNIESYPIEVAWSDEKGVIVSYLINPYSIDSWCDWDFYAQSIHGISREQCRAQGVHPTFVCEQMNQTIQPGEIIYADGWPFDQYWIDTLFKAGSEIGFSKFRILHSDRLMLPMLETVGHAGSKLELYEQLKLAARKKVGGRHRAKIDVQYLIELYRLCVKSGIYYDDA
jgi:hypothetical protein